MKFPLETMRRHQVAISFLWSARVTGETGTVTQCATGNAALPPAPCRSLPPFSTQTFQVFSMAKRRVHLQLAIRKGMSYNRCHLRSSDLQLDPRGLDVVKTRHDKGRAIPGAIGVS